MFFTVVEPPVPETANWKFDAESMLLLQSPLTTQFSNVTSPITPPPEVVTVLKFR